MAEVESMADRGTANMKLVTAVLLNDAGWLPVVNQSFETCEINFYDEVTGTRVGGVVGFKFSTKGQGGRPSVVYANMGSVSAVQMEEPEGAK